MLDRATEETSCMFDHMADILLPAGNIFGRLIGRLELVGLTEIFKFKFMEEQPLKYEAVFGRCAMELCKDELAPERRRRNKADPSNGAEGNCGEANCNDIQAWFSLKLTSLCLYLSLLALCTCVCVCCLWLSMRSYAPF